MRYLGLDLGTRTLGLSISDRLGKIATSYKVLHHEDNHKSLINDLKDIVKQEKIEAFVLGFPKNMNNTIGPRGEASISFKEKLIEEFKLPVYLIDERLTTVEATNILIKNDTSRKKRKKVIDSLAATIILQSYLDRKGE